MRAVKGRDTKPELHVRRLAHALGFRFRLHREDLPGRPDLAFPRLRKAIFVHGCFWHGHDCARGARTPVNNRAYWVRKIARNQERDARALHDLQALGWTTLVIWECELRSPSALELKLRNFLEVSGIDAPRAPQRRAKHSRARSKSVGSGR
jgi:DNA mismatch endonuclease (patch repair protein)